jgi:hypothetical protein
MAERHRDDERAGVALDDLEAARDVDDFALVGQVVET